MSPGGRPRFTVLIDNYNHEAEVGPAIQSVLDQDFPASEVEIVVVDDGSTDRSREVIDSFGDQVRRVYQANQRQTRALHNGFAAARGEIVCLLDSDDFCHPRRLKTLAERFEDPGVVGAQHYMGRVDGRGKVLATGQPSWPDRFTLEHFMDHQFHFGATSGMAFRKSCLDLVLPTPPFDHFYLDCFLVSGSLLYGSVACIREELSFWRVGGRHTCVAPMAEPRTQEWEWRMRELFIGEMGRRLAGQGLAFGPSFLKREEAEMLRRELLFYAYRGERRKGLATLLKAAKALEPGGFAAFRCATLALTLLSPRLYMALFGLYYRHPAWGDLRQRLLPGHS